MSSPAISCRGLVKRYPGVTAVDGIDLEVPRGECFGMLGPNGAGKTTTIEVLEGLLDADEGTVHVLGQTWETDERELRERLGVQLQETKLPDKLTVEETVRLFRSFYRRGTAVDDVLEAVSLAEKRGAWVAKLSGGQRQRLAVACALVCEPEILFLDEPTTGLDPQSRRQMWDIIERFRSEGRTVMLTTHYMEEAQRLCDRVAIIDRGRVIALGAPAELIASLGADQVVEFTADGPVDTASVERIEEVQGLRAQNGVVSLTVREVHRAVPALLVELKRQQVSLTRLTTHHATLEDVFVALTGRHLREN